LRGVLEPREVDGRLDGFKFRGSPKNGLGFCADNL
jgi:hypothetical protein